MPDNPPPPSVYSDEEAAKRAYDKRLLRRLDSNDLIARGAAIQECRRLPVDHIVRLTHALEGKPRRIPTDKRGRALFWMVTGLVSALTLLMFGLATGQALCLLGAIAILVLFFAWAGDHDMQVKRYSARAENSLAIVIGQIRDPAFLPIAMQMLYSRHASILSDDETEMTKALSHAAAHLLKTLDIEDIKAVGIRQQAFYWFLSRRCWRDDPGAAIRVLQVLEVVGTSSAIPTVHAVSIEAAWWRDLHPVRDAAQACLAALKEREKEARLPRMLLRASEAPAPSAETLLRPATESADSAPAQLLRPAATSAAGEPPVSGTLIHENNQTQAFERVQVTRIQSG